MYKIVFCAILLVECNWILFFFYVDRSICIYVYGLRTHSIELFIETNPYLEIHEKKNAVYAIIPWLDVTNLFVPTMKIKALMENVPYSSLRLQLQLIYQWRTKGGFAKRKKCW